MDDEYVCFFLRDEMINHIFYIFIFREIRKALKVKEQMKKQEANNNKEEKKTEKQKSLNS